MAPAHCLGTRSRGMAPAHCLGTRSRGMAPAHCLGTRSPGHGPAPLSRDSPWATPGLARRGQALPQLEEVPLGPRRIAREVVARREQLAADTRRPAPPHDLARRLAGPRRLVHGSLARDHEVVAAGIEADLVEDELGAGHQLGAERGERSSQAPGRTGAGNVRQPAQPFRELVELLRRRALLPRVDVRRIEQARAHVAGGASRQRQLAKHFAHPGAAVHRDRAAEANEERPPLTLPPSGADTSARRTAPPSTSSVPSPPSATGTAIASAPPARRPFASASAAAAADKTPFRLAGAAI